MKFLQKLISMLLCILLIFSLCSTVIAEESTEDETGTIGSNVEESNAEDDEILKESSESPGDEDPLEEEADENEEDLFPGMPEGYTLSESEKALKKRIYEIDLPEKLSEMESGENYVEGEVVIFAESEEYANMVAEAYGGEIVYYENEVAVIVLPDEATTIDAIDEASNIVNNMPAVFPNFIYYISPIIEEKQPAKSGITTYAGESAPTKKAWESTFDDPFLKNPNAGVSGYQWFHDAVGSYAAWGSTMGDGVIVAVLDTGIQTNHPDLLPVETGYNATPTSSIEDAHGHGTHVAGIIAARANSIGGRGVAPNAKILPVKVLNDSGSATTGSISSGINWVVNGNSQRRADIINMSLGGYSIDLATQLSITTAINKGIVVVAAAGNDGNNNQLMPASYPGVICVAGTEMTGQRYYASNYGSQITIAAPGYEVLST